MVRRALAMAAGEQYGRLAVNLVMILCVSRLLTPSEMGIAVIGTGAVTIALGLREFATTDFLIRRTEVTQRDLGSAFTIILGLSALIAAMVAALAPLVAELYSEPGLTLFLRVLAAAGVVEALALPVIGVLRREMAFGTLALIHTSAAAVTAATTIALAIAGLGYMSFAWGGLAAAATTTALALRLRPLPAGLRPGLGSWRSVLAFGGYNGASFTINRIYEALPQLVLGHLLPPAAVGLYNRAGVVSDIPDRIILSSVLAVAFPALAEQRRNGHSLGEAYLRAVALLTAVYWPAQVLLLVLARPVVALLLGEQWLDVVPLLQVMTLASFAWFPVVLAAPVLLALGANRDRTLADLAGRSVSAVVLCAAAPMGIMAMAVSKLVTIPFQAAVALAFVRRHLELSWFGLAAAMAKSALVTTTSALGPVLLVLSGLAPEAPLPSVALALALAFPGWLLGVLLTRHPVLEEIGHLATGMTAGGVRLSSLRPAPSPISGRRGGARLR